MQILFQKDIQVNLNVVLISGKGQIKVWNQKLNIILYMLQMSDPKAKIISNGNPRVENQRFWGQCIKVQKHRYRRTQKQW